jgi:hypothetical protein
MPVWHATEHRQPLLAKVALSERSVRGQLGQLLDRPCLLDADALREAAALLSAAAELADIVGRLPARALLASGHAAGARPARREGAGTRQHRPAADVVQLLDRRGSPGASS